MSRPASPVQVANVALAYLGEPPIASINPGSTTREKLASSLYDMTRQEMLCEIPWNFAKELGQCAKSTTGPTFGWASKYQMPNDCLQLLFIGGSYDDSNGSAEMFNETDYDINGRYILTDSTDNSINIGYIKDVTDVSIWPPLFLNVMALKLALKMAYPVTKSIKVVQSIEIQLSRELPSALSVDGREKKPIKRNRSRLLDTRRGVLNSDPRYIVTD